MNKIDKFLAGLKKKEKTQIKIINEREDINQISQK